MTVAQSAKPYSSNITVTLKRLVALLEEEETDEYGILQPSQSAFKLAMRLVVDAFEIMGDSFPRASASTDEQGSIRLTWNKKEAPSSEVRLVCPADANQQAYLYHEMEDNYAVEHDITTSILVQWLEWLNQG
ncbi:hypothetical protein NIES4071_54120 [Calothrix sp. NIES-4071]|nr:hypothetical protein NIES4071_54120 [Calothrix sp. NIES-4071]BAZ59720.1 hypothetical protein NIES4105_54070 [Calothrix sp. NIES-4105]